MVDDGHSAHVVINRVIDVLGKCCATSGNNDGASRHVRYAKVDFTCIRAFVAASKKELVVFGNLLRNGLCAVIEFTEAILVGQDRVVNPFCQMFTERLCNWEDDAALIDGVAFHEVELPIGMRIVLCVEAVEVESSEEDGVLELLFGQIAEIDAGGVALVLDV